MNAKPLVDELLSQPVAGPALAYSDAPRTDNPERDIALGSGENIGRFSIYAPQAAFDLVDELDFLTRRAIDHNIFFAPQFLIPAMPRLDDRSVRLIVVRDQARRRSRLRLLMPYTLERAGLLRGVPTIRAWTHPFGPLGSLPVDQDDPEGTLASLLNTLARPDLGLPGILVLPDLRLGSPMAEATRRAVERLELPWRMVNQFSRAALVKGEADGIGAEPGLSPKRRRDLARQRRLLELRGTLSFEAARDPAGVRHALEEFLLLEASGWKGRGGSAMILDRFRAAFAREAVNGLAEAGRAGVYTLRLDGRPVASLVVFFLEGEAFAWKTAYDEAHSQASPGFQLMMHVREELQRDDHVQRFDSCAVPDHFLMNRVFPQRLDIGTMVIGLTPDAQSKVEAAARGLMAMRRSRNLARLMRGRVRAMLRFG